MRARVVLVVSVSMFCASCGSSPPLEHPELPFRVPEQWASAPLADAEVPVEWWREFDEPALDALIEEAILANPSLYAAAAAVEAALAGAAIVGADAYPSADLGMTAQRQRVQFFAPGFGQQTNRFTTVAPALNLSWEIDLWGRIRAGHDAAIADAEAARVAFHSALLSLIAQVVKGYYAVGESAAQLTIARENEASVASLTSRIEDRYRSGLRSALDLRLARADLERARAATAVAESRAAESRRLLELLLGRYPGAAAGSDEWTLPDALGTVPGGLPSTLLARRPDVVRAERELAAQSRRLDEAELSLLPRLALTASGGSVAEDLADVLRQDFSVWNVIGNLAAPIFDGHRLTANVDRNRADLDGALARYVDVVQRAFAEVEATLLAEQHLARQEGALAAARDNAGAALEIAEQRYFGGVFDIVDLLDARRRDFDARSAHLTVRLVRVFNRIDLILALGGGFRDERWNDDSETAMNDTGGRFEEEHAD